MSARNRLENKQARRAEREERKGAFQPRTLSFLMPETRVKVDEEGNPVIDEESGEEVKEIVQTDKKKFYHLPTRADKRGNRVRGRRGKGI